MDEVRLQSSRLESTQHKPERQQAAIQLGKRSVDNTGEHNRNCSPANSNGEEIQERSSKISHDAPVISHCRISQLETNDEWLSKFDPKLLVIEEEDNTESLESTTCSRSLSHTNCGKSDCESIMTDKSCENRIDITIGISTLPKNETNENIFMISQNKHNHNSKTMEQRSVYSTPNQCRDLTFLKGGEQMFLERAADSPQSTETFLLLISSDRTKLQKLMKFCSPVACPKREEVRIFASTQKKELAILKKENHLIFLTGLDKPGFASKLSSNCIQYKLERTERVNQMCIVDKECDIDPLVPDMIYCGILYDDLWFQELIFDSRFSNKGTCLRKLSFRFSEPGSLNIIGLEYSPYIKHHDNLAQFARVVLIRDESESVRINAFLVERGIPEEQRMAEFPEPDSVVHQHFILPKKKYQIEGQVFAYHYTDPYNRPILMVIPKLLTSILVIELSCTTDTFAVRLCKVAISAPKRENSECEGAGAISETGTGTPSQVDWVIPPSQAVLKGIVTLLCDGYKQTVHIRRINPQSNPDDYLPPTVRHLDELLADG